MRRAGAGRKIAPGVLLAIVLVVGALALIIAQMTNGSLGQRAQQTGDGVAADAGRGAPGPARAGEGFLGRLAAMWGAGERLERLERENRELQAWR
jgi:hypothetical protein